MAEQKTNRLINSSSPYLLQHAHNPVEWYPWGNEALEEARKLDKPIIVSIGYSSCHWCHVMERESFENDSIAEIMNAHFINIKVDREERPDIDQVYMEAVHAMGLQGGWPLNVFLTPDQKPFYGGTYFPPNGWGKLLMSVAKAYKENRDKLEESAEKFTEALNRSEIKRFGLQSSTELNENLLKEGYSTLSKQFDHKNGGFNRAPKFPMPSIYQFLIRYYHATKEESILKHIKLTLNKMAEGGIYDQIGGGFARYSVDELWHAPHFEKMLYDNGQLLSLYAEAYKLENNEAYKTIIHETISWLKREMLSLQGGFYSALDADSEGVEGKYYVWKRNEIDSILGEDAELFNKYYSVTENGNWEEEVNILHAISSAEDFAASNQIDAAEFTQLLNDCKEKLLAIRKERIAPGLDDKIITGWNALTLKGLVDSYIVTDETEYLELAIKNAEFLEKYMYSSKTGKLMRNWQSSHPEYQVSAVLEDYATLIEALIALYQATFNEKWLGWSKKLLEFALENFFDDKENMFFYKSKEDEALIARKKELFDNVIPSSNSIMARNLHLLGVIFDNNRWVELSQTMVSTVSSFFEKALSDTSNWARAYSELLYPFPEIAIVGNQTGEFRNEIMKSYYSGMVVVGTQSSSDLPLLQNRANDTSDTTIFVCFNKACRLPVKSVPEALEQLP